MAHALLHFFDRSALKMGDRVRSRSATHDDGVFRDEQLRTVWAHARLGVLVAAVFAIALGLSLRGTVATTGVVDAWLFFKLVILALRGVQSWRFARLPPAGTRSATASWWAVVIDAASWGVAGAYVAVHSRLEIASFCVAVLACITCVATFGLQVSARFTAGYAAPILLPTAAGMFLRSETLGQLGAFGLVALLALQVATAVRSERRMAEGVRLRLQAEALALEKEDALKAAVRQSAVKTQFLANMSHELRTPLHGILGMARLLHMDLRDPGQARRVELIEASGTHLLALINDLLDISRIEAGQFVIRNEPFDLAAQIEQLAGIYTMRTEDKGLTLKVAHDLPVPCWVMGDPARFRQVLHNLLGNAVKFTQRGGITLRVGRDAAAGMVCAKVVDTGVGIAKEDLGKIFEAFKQSESGAQTLSTEGVGLGLTIARDIARAMGGDITVESELGKGSTLTFTACLPDAPAPALRTVPAGSYAPSAPSTASEPSAPATTDPAPVAMAATANPSAASTQAGQMPAPSAATSQGSGADAGGGGGEVSAPAGAAAGDAESPGRPPAVFGAPRHCLVLLAEDNDINALVASNFLDIIGTDTERVKDGQEAVREALRDTNRPDIVLMDCQMPVVNGFEATRMIRAQERELGLPRIPILALTATASDTERQSCLDAGMDDFLSKPYMLEELTGAIERWAPEGLIRPPATGAAARTDAAVPYGSPAGRGASFRT